MGHELQGMFTYCANTLKISLKNQLLKSYAKLVLKAWIQWRIQDFPWGRAPTSDTGSIPQKQMSKRKL